MHKYYYVNLNKKQYSLHRKITLHIFQFTYVVVEYILFGILSLGNDYLVVGSVCPLAEGNLVIQQREYLKRINIYL